MRVQKNRTHLAYLCDERFCVSVESTRLEAFVTELVLQRLERNDALDLFVPPNAKESVAAAERELAELKERLDAFYAQAAAGRLSPGGLAKVEERLLPQISEAKTRTQLPPVPSVLRDLQGPQARDVWPDLSIGLQREAVHWLLDLSVGKTYRGARRLDPWRLADSRWRGSGETWGEIWGREGKTPFVSDLVGGASGERDRAT
jgi:hypothetical protein